MALYVHAPPHMSFPVATQIAFTSVLFPPSEHLLSRDSKTLSLIPTAAVSPGVLQAVQKLVPILSFTLSLLVISPFQAR